MQALAYLPAASWLPCHTAPRNQSALWYAPDMSLFPSYSPFFFWRLKVKRTFAIRFRYLLMNAVALLILRSIICAQFLPYNKHIMILLNIQLPFGLLQIFNLFFVYPEYINYRQYHENLQRLSLLQNNIYLSFV